MRRFFWLGGFGLVLVLFLGCQAVIPTRLPSPTDAPPTLAPNATATATIRARRTRTASPTVEPSPGPSPTPAFQLHSIEIEHESWSKAYDEKTGRWEMAIHSRSHTWAFGIKSHYETHGVNEEQEFAYSVITDGETDWTYHPLENLVKINPVRPQMLQLSNFYGFGSKDLPSLIQFLSETKCFEAQQAGEEIIAGRNAYRVEIGPNKCAKNPNASDAGPRTGWFDKESFIELREEIYSQDRSQVVTHYDTLSIQLNVPLDDALFTFVPPQGATITDERLTPSPYDTRTPTPAVLPTATP